MVKANFAVCLVMLFVTFNNQNLMAKKSAICGEFVITISDNDSVTVNKIYKSTMAALKEIAAANGFEVSPNWNTQDLGRKLLSRFCNGEKDGAIGEYLIEREANQRINVLRTFGNTIEGLRQCADSINFAYEKDWNTQYFGNVLVNYVENNKN